MQQHITKNTNLADFKDIHKGQTIIVCGCGSSLNTLSNPGQYITIGVNDVGRLFDPTYLVVLNPKSQFKGERFRYVKESKAGVIFTQINLHLNNQQIVNFKLGDKGGTDVSGLNSLPYTKNSPYVAVCLAAYMGANRIGVIGVDFTNHHFFAKTGRHTLNGQIDQINREYVLLNEAFIRKGIEVFNLSKKSCLTAFKKMSLTEFSELVSLKDDISNKSIKDILDTNASRRREMKIAIERHKSGIIGDFMNNLASTANKLGYSVKRNVSTNQTKKDEISIVWNGRKYPASKRIIYCEHGWLPRGSYQVSPKGINADSHISPFHWDGEPISMKDKEMVDRYLLSLREESVASHEYMKTTAPIANGLPKSFILMPLQIEQDTNILRHVPKNLRRMQDVIDFVSKSNPPYPVIFKQHPADRKRMNQHLNLKTRRKKDVLRRHDKGNIHQILKSGNCKGIISLNSNVVHDGLLWGIPSVVLGNNIWPKNGVSPFINGIPQDWSQLENFFQDSNVIACRDAYIKYLIDNQWTLEDTKNIHKVSSFLESVINHSYDNSNLATFPVRNNSSDTRQRVVNIVARNKGWLFEDLKSHFLKASISGVKVITSEIPRKDVDAWIYLRTHEVINTPDASRTLVQIHDLFDNGLYKYGGKRHFVAECGAVTLTNPVQKTILESNGIHFNDSDVINMPLGASECFSLRSQLSEKFTLGWVGRPVVYDGDEFKRVEWLVEALRSMGDLKDSLKVVLIGERLDKIKKSINCLGFECDYVCRKYNPYSTYAKHYRELDCVLVTSKFAAGPNCLYEALSSGVPVVSTRVGHSIEFIKDGVNGYLVDSISDIQSAIHKIKDNRKDWFERRESIRNTAVDYSLESWVETNINTALNLISSEVRNSRLKRG